MNGTTPSSRVDSIRRSLVSLKMPRTLEILDATVRRIEQGQIDRIEAIDELLGEELSLRKNRRIEAALRMARLPVVKTLAGYDFSFQPSLDKNRILALAGLGSPIAPKLSICSARPAPARATLPRHSRSRRCAPARQSTLSRSPI